VVAAYLKFLGESCEDTDSAVAHHGALAVHGVVEHVQVAAECFHNALQSQAHAEYRQAQADGGLYQVGDAEIRGAAGAR